MNTAKDRQSNLFSEEPSQPFRQPQPETPLQDSSPPGRMETTDFFPWRRFAPLNPAFKKRVEEIAIRLSHAYTIMSNRMTPNGLLVMAFRLASSGLSAAQIKNGIERCENELRYMFLCDILLRANPPGWMVETKPERDPLISTRVQ